MGPAHRSIGGKIADVAALVAAYGEEIEADLAHHYNGLDLRDLWRKGGGASRLTYRRLKVLIDRLPPESATNTAIRSRFTDAELAEMAANGKGGYGPWARSDYWFASIADRIDHLTYALIRVNGGKPDEPEPTPRPGLVPRHTGDTSAPPDPALVAMLESRRAEHRQRQQQLAAPSAAEAQPGGACASAPNPPGEQEQDSDLTRRQQP